MSPENVLTSSSSKSPKQDPDPEMNQENVQTLDTQQPNLFAEDVDSTCSTPYVSAPSSPGRVGPVNGGFFYSCPASPMHFAITSTAAVASSSSCFSSPDNGSVPLGYEFEFAARHGGSTGSGQPGWMSSADELFLNGQIRPMKLSTHLQRPQALAPLLDLENEEEDEDDGAETKAKVGFGESGRGRDLRLKNKSLRRRKTRSLSPLRSASFELVVADEEGIGDEFNKAENGKKKDTSSEVVGKEEENGKMVLEEEEEENGSVPSSVSASSSRSSSAGRNSKRWVFLKDFLYRSKSEGRTSNNKFWSNISFSPAKEKIKSMAMASSSSNVHSKEKAHNSNNNNVTNAESQKAANKKPVNGIGKRRVPAASPHELHYKASRAQAEEMRKKTYLPYKQGLLGCLGFSSKGYGAMNGFARALNPVSSR